MNNQDLAVQDWKSKGYTHLRTLNISLNRRSYHVVLMVDSNGKKIAINKDGGTGGLACEAALQSDMTKRRGGRR